MHNLHLLLQRLCEAQLDFVLIGGYASVVHGSAYITFDLDICTTLSPESVAKLRSVLHPAHTTVSEVDRLQLETADGIVDVRSTVLGIGDYARLRQTAERISLFGQTCSVISLEDLITAKEAVGREKDLLAVKELRAIAAKRATPPRD